jgi:hypothetical protein
VVSRDRLKCSLRVLADHKNRRLEDRFQQYDEHRGMFRQPGSQQGRGLRLLGEADRQRPEAVEREPPEHRSAMKSTNKRDWGAKTQEITGT